MKYEDKQIDVRRNKKPENEGEDFMFPHSPSPITIRAKDIHEAQEKFQKIISKQVEE